MKFVVYTFIHIYVLVGTLHRYSCTAWSSFVFHKKKTSMY